MPLYDRKVLLVTLGRHRVGKTSVSRRFTQGVFDEEQFSTVGALHLEKTTLIDELRVNVEIMDTAGQEQYESVSKQYYTKADGAVVVYDITSSESFERAKFWVQLLKEEGPTGLITVLAGNKLDLTETEEREVSTEQGASFAMMEGIMFAEVSALTGVGIDQLFTDLVSAIPLSPELKKHITLSTFDASEAEGGCC